jgi:hypothetical protein
MHERIDHGANLLKSQVFQFDFLNDEFIPVSKGGKMPDSLFDIINNEEKRKKLVMYINPPYAEIAGNKSGVNLNKIHDKYQNQLEVANRELYAQFLIRIYNEIQNCIIGEFSKLKALTGSNFLVFRNNFKAKLIKCFLSPADTFDNVKGKFPIGFKIWNTSIVDFFKEINCDVYDKNGNFIFNKLISSYENDRYFSVFVNDYKKRSGTVLGWLEGITRNDFQSQNGILIVNKKEQIAVPRGMYLYKENLIFVFVSFSIRHCIEATWLNDRDQFLYPNDGWESDTEFQNDCLAFALFHGQNRITSQEGVNHWIPFTEREVNAQAKFESRFMTDFIQGKIKTEQEAGDLFGSDKKSLIPTQPLVFSDEACAVFDAGRALWTYYHAQKFAPQFPSSGGVTEGRGGNEGRGGKAGGTIYNPNASLYDIREHFQGRNEAGKMNNKSQDEQYNQLIATLRESLKTLAKKIEPKVYEYGFLKG